VVGYAGIIIKKHEMSPLAELAKETVESYVTSGTMVPYWQTEGEKVIYKRTQEKVIQILENHEPSALPVDARAGILSIYIYAE